MILLILVLNFLNLTSVSALSIVVHVPEKYLETMAGERFYFEVEIKYPENPSRKDLRLEYEIKKDDEVIAQSKVLKAVETQASFIDSIVIPENAKTGLHKINIKVSDYEDLSEEVFASFYVIGDEGDQLRNYFFIIFGVIVFISFLAGVEVYLIKRKEG